MMDNVGGQHLLLQVVSDKENMSKPEPFPIPELIDSYFFDFLWESNICPIGSGLNYADNNISRRL